MQTAIVTGANGFIGCRLVYELLGRGYRVHALGRASGGARHEDRVHIALTGIHCRPIHPAHLSRLTCHEVELTEPDLGLSQPFSDLVCGTDAILFHLAGDTRFNPPDREAQRQINIGGPVNVVRALADCLASVVHVSTAFVAGDRRGLVLESEHDRGQRFCNAYEKSKLEAELAVTQACASEGLPCKIIRPSIVTNDTRTGRSSTFTHLNAVVEVVDRIQRHYGIGDGQVVSNEIRLPVSPKARPNLVPIDSIVDSLIEIGTHPEGAGKTYHLCHPHPQTNSEVVSLISEAFGVKGLVSMPFVSSIPDDPTWTERMLLRSLRSYLPYLSESRTFDLTNTRALIPDYDSRFCHLTLGYMRKVIEFQRHRSSPLPLRASTAPQKVLRETPSTHLMACTGS